MSAPPPPGDVVPSEFETRVGALLVPKSQVQEVLRALPPGALREGRRCTPWHGERDFAALHLSHDAASALGEGDALSAVGALVAERLASGGVLWAPGLRPLSAACRTPAEDEEFAAWRRVGGGGFRFVELFAGIGGFRLGLEPLGGRCVFAAEVDPGARAVYSENFRDEAEPLGDVEAIDAADIPEHDILTAGFPCQPFAQCNTGNAALTGSLREGPGIHGRERGGALAFEVVRILRSCRPPAFLLENVPNLQNFNDGRDLATLQAALVEAGYDMHVGVLDAKHWGLPQQRKRLYLAGLLRERLRPGLPRLELLAPPPCARPLRLRDVLDPPEEVPPECWLSEAVWAELLERDPKACRISGRGGRLARLDGYARTLTSSYRTRWRCMGELVPAVEPEDTAEEDCDASPASDPLLYGERPPPPRFFTLRECCRLQGFPDTFATRSRSRRCQDPMRFYHLIGNAVVPRVVGAIAAATLRAAGVLPSAEGADAREVSADGADVGNAADAFGDAPGVGAEVGGRGVSDLGG